MARRSHILVVIGTVVLGFYFLGHGAYIYAKAHVAQVLLHAAWERTLRGESNVKPWPWADTWPMARLRAAAHGVDEIILAGDSGRVLAFGPGANFGFAPPGTDGTSVISAHRDTHFRFLRDVHVGDELSVQVATGQWRRYRVAAARVVDARAALEFPELGAPQLLLVTCYPFDTLVPGGPLRYVITAVEPDATPL